LRPRARIQSPTAIAESCLIWPCQPHHVALGRMTIEFARVRKNRIRPSFALEARATSALRLGLYQQHHAAQGFSSRAVRNRRICSARMLCLWEGRLDLARTPQAMEIVHTTRVCESKARSCKLVVVRRIAASSFCKTVLLYRIAFPALRCKLAYSKTECSVVVICDRYEDVMHMSPHTTVDTADDDRSSYPMRLPV